jgi:hypothetical protein
MALEVAAAVENFCGTASVSLTRWWPH